MEAASHPATEEEIAVTEIARLLVEHVEEVPQSEDKK
jgi:hypothetical protein